MCKGIIPRATLTLINHYAYNKAVHFEHLKQKLYNHIQKKPDLLVLEDDSVIFAFCWECSLVFVGCCTGH